MPMCNNRSSVDPRSFEMVTATKRGLPLPDHLVKGTLDVDEDFHRGREGKKSGIISPP